MRRVNVRPYKYSDRITTESGTHWLYVYPWYLQVKRYHGGQPPTKVREPVIETLKRLTRKRGI